MSLDCADVILPSNCSKVMDISGHLLVYVLGFVVIQDSGCIICVSGCVYCKRVNTMCTMCEPPFSHTFFFASI